MNVDTLSGNIVVDLKRLEVHARDGPSDPYALAKWRILNRLHDRNETMYYKVFITWIFHLKDCRLLTISIEPFLSSGLFKRSDAVPLCVKLSSNL